MYAVEKLLERRVHGKGRVEVLVQWSGYGPAHNSWEPISEIKRSCPEMVQALNDQLRRHKRSCPEQVQAPDNQCRRSSKRTSGPDQTPRPGKVPRTEATQTSTPQEEPAPSSASAAANGQAEGKSEYEREREARIARNREMLRQLGLLEAKDKLDSANAKPAPKARRTLSKPAHTGPLRKSRRTVSAAEGKPAGDAGGEDDESWRPSSSTTGRTFYYSEGRDCE